MLKFISISRVVTRTGERKHDRNPSKREIKIIFRFEWDLVFDCPTFFYRLVQSVQFEYLQYHSLFLSSSFSSTIPCSCHDSCTVLSMHSFVNKLLAICNSYFMWFITILCNTAIYPTEIGFYKLKLHFRVEISYFFSVSSKIRGRTQIGLHNKSSMQLDWAKFWN